MDGVVSVRDGDVSERKVANKQCWNTSCILDFRLQPIRIINQTPVLLSLFVCFLCIFAVGWKLMELLTKNKILKAMF